MAIGAGWQAVVAYVNIACYYIFGIPLGLVLGYKLDMGVQVSIIHIYLQIFWIKLPETSYIYIYICSFYRTIQYISKLNNNLCACNLQGIWIGMLTGTVVQTLVLFWIVYRTNWNKEVNILNIAITFFLEYLKQTKIHLIFFICWFGGLNAGFYCWTQNKAMGRGSSF